MTWNDPCRIHLGCGPHRLTGWVNVDGDVKAKPDVLLDIHTQLGEIPDGIATHIYWSHGPEHIFPDMLADVIKQLRRVLKTEGWLTIATIDLEGIYHNRYKRPLNGSAWNSALYGETLSTDHPFAAHRQCFTVPLLRHFFQEWGFRSVRQWEPENYPEIQAINDYATSCRLVTAHVEGMK